VIDNHTRQRVAIEVDIAAINGKQIVAAMKRVPGKAARRQPWRLMS
jgi:hypothetical protein